MTEIIQMTKENLDCQFDQYRRHHYYLNVIAEDYDADGNHPVYNVVYSIRVHMTRKELEQAAEHLTNHHIQKHHGITVEALPDSFNVLTAEHTTPKGTEADETGQIRFSL